MSQETIYSLSSGAGRAGVAVIRVSGPDAGPAVKALARRLPPVRRASLCRLAHPVSGSLIDEALVLWMEGPQSFTGEDSAEFHVHGGRAVVAAALDALGSLDGLRPAEAGEFTKRAFINGRLDLVAVEGLADLIAAETEVQRRLALFHSGGGASSVFEAWRAELINVLARLEAVIDFVDEAGVAEAALSQALPRLSALRDAIRTSLDSRHRGERLREGVRIVLAGPPNVGKSSLLNRLAQRDAAIVSPTPGTTRDVIEVHLDLAGVPVVVSDTAGLRGGSADEIEAIGMARTRATMSAADLVVWVSAPDVEAGQGPPPEIDSDSLWILNKADLSGYCWNGAELEVSAVTGKNVDALVGRLSEWATQRFAGAESALIARDRQRRAIEDCCAHLERATGGGLPVELVTEEVRLAARAMARLVGRIDVEDLLDVVFRDFCIGK
ncbi:MAG TPA: tRNA uridine-5-carboxymethylaminomethyl(34) synthesis GTPase MnmE [Candidatus Polarisedimenticolia bacterium]|nr:tRNA uridine-5-carboxymethylaminomethyl(34) synthesis GTPase MnmE [Candidatus Polarisedimenticolia bacterium]